MPAAASCVVERPGVTTLDGPVRGDFLCAASLVDAAAYPRPHPTKGRQGWQMASLLPRLPTEGDQGTQTAPGGSDLNSLQKLSVLILYSNTRTGKPKGGFYTPLFPNYGLLFIISPFLLPCFTQLSNT